MKEIRVDTTGLSFAEFTWPTCVHQRMTPKLDGQRISYWITTQIPSKKASHSSSLLCARVAVPKTRIQVDVGCCRFQRHRVRCMNETGGEPWSDASLRESLSWRR